MQPEQGLCQTDSPQHCGALIARGSPQVDSGSTAVSIKLHFRTVRSPGRPGIHAWSPQSCDFILILWLFGIS